MKFRILEQFLHKCFELAHPVGRCSTTTRARRFARQRTKLSVLPLEERQLLSVTPNDSDPPAMLQVQSDTVMPLVTGVFTANSQGQTSHDPLTMNERGVSKIPQLVFAFSEAMATSGAGDVTSLSNWQIRRNGVDISSAVSGVTFRSNVTTAKHEAVIVFNTSLTDGKYEFVARSTLADAAGNPLDGAGDGGTAEDYVHRFVISTPLAVGGVVDVSTATGGWQVDSQGIAIDGQGNIIVAWAPGQGSEGSYLGAWLRRFTPQGVPLGPSARLDSLGALTAEVATDDAGNFVVVWDEGNIMARRFDSEGQPLGSVFTVHSTASTNPVFPSVAMDSTGDFVVVWQSGEVFDQNGDVYGQRFDSAGGKVGSEFLVNTTTISSQQRPQVAMDDAGDFVVVWESTAGGGYSIFAQRYSSAGAPLGSNFRINANPTFQERRPIVATDADGDFVVTWYSTQAGNDDIFARRFGANGAAVGSEFRVNQITTGFQQIPRVALDDDGDMVFAWRTVAAGGTSGNSYRRFSADGEAQGSEFQFNTSTTSTAGMPTAVAIDGDGDFVVAWADPGNVRNVHMQRFAGQLPLNVIGFTSTPTGFVAEFDQDVDPDALNLYDQGGAFSAADVIVTGATTGVVRGSLVVDPGLRKVTFIKTGGPLLPDSYTVTLRSGAAAFKSVDGGLLDGNLDGTAGDDAVRQFTVASPTEALPLVTLSIPNFTRGAGQDVNVAGATSLGIPIRINSGQQVSGIDFKLKYDPELLDITAVTLGSGLQGASMLSRLAAPGELIVTVSAAGEFSSTAGALTLVNLIAEVPAGATYAAQHVLDLTDVHVYDASFEPQERPSIDDDGIHVAAYFGDANGSQSYNSPDATFAQRIIVGSDTGLSAYRLSDPFLIVDISGNGQVQSDDVTQIQRAIVGTATPEIPPIPVLSSLVHQAPAAMLLVAGSSSSGEGKEESSDVTAVSLAMAKPSELTADEVSFASDAAGEWQFVRFTPEDTAPVTSGPEGLLAKPGGEFDFVDALLANSSTLSKCDVEVDELVKALTRAGRLPQVTNRCVDVTVDDGADS